MPPRTDPSKSDFDNLVSLLSVYTEAQNRLDHLNAQANEAFIDIVDEHRGEYAQLLESQTEAESAIEILALKHPEWFAEKKTVKVPFGTVKVTKSTSLKADNEEASIILIETSARPDKASLIRVHAELNLEALEALTDDELRAFRIKRITDQNVKVTAAKVDMGKAVKQAASKEGLN